MCNMYEYVCWCLAEIIVEFAISAAKFAETSVKSSYPQFWWSYPLSPTRLYAPRILALKISQSELWEKSSNIRSLVSVSKHARVHHNFGNFSISGRVNCPSSKSPYISEKEFPLRGRARISRYSIWREESFIIYAVGENVRSTSVWQQLQLRSIQAISIWHFPPQFSFSHIAFHLFSPLRVMRDVNYSAAFPSEKRTAAKKISLLLFCIWGLKFLKDEWC